MAKKASRTKSVKRNKGFNKKEFSLFMLAFAIVGIFTLWVSLAAPHNGGGKPSHGGGSATLTLSPTSVPSGGLFSGTGCGYTIGKQVNVSILSPSSSYFYPTGVDANGCISFGNYASEAGQYTVSTYQALSGGSKQTLMATAPLTVY
jgi:hypothetical protein